MVSVFTAKTMPLRYLLALFVRSFETGSSVSDSLGLEAPFGCA
jgi:hypothetical protein